MKKTTLFFLSLFSISLIFTSCNKDDDTKPGDNFPGVPSGDIVPVEEREAALTGGGNMKSVDNNLKYWSFTESKALVSGCGESDEIDLLQQLGYSSDTKLAFSQDGNIYVKSYGSVNIAGGWSWSSSSKDGIILDSHPSVEFTFTVLNPSEVVYASKQTGEYEYCENTTIITYERMIYGACGDLGPNGLSSDINSLLTEDFITALIDHGMVINTGCNPPDIQGSYINSPNMVHFTSVPNELPGSRFPDLFFTFYDQDNLTIKWDANSTTIHHYGLGGFLSGDGDKFSVFIMVEVEHIDSPVIADGIVIVSGEISDNGIINYTQSNYMVDNKGNPGDVFIDNGTGRILKDGNGLATRTSFSKGSDNPNSISSLFWKDPILKD